MMTQNLEGRFESVTVKAVIIAVLTIVMLWPLARVESLVNERQALQHQAYEGIAAGFGGPAIVGAPLLSGETQEGSGPIDSSTKKSNETWAAGSPLHLLPDDVEINADVTVDLRSKGI